MDLIQPEHEQQAKGIILCVHNQFALGKLHGQIKGINGHITVNRVSYSLIPGSSYD